VTQNTGNDTRFQAGSKSFGPSIAFTMRHGALERSSTRPSLGKARHDPLKAQRHSKPESRRALPPAGSLKSFCVFGIETRMNLFFNMPMTLFHATLCDNLLFLTEFLSHGPHGRIPSHVLYYRIPMRPCQPSRRICLCLMRAYSRRYYLYLI